VCIGCESEMADAIREAEDAALERAAMVCVAERERIKHTSHRDGLGMGDLSREAECLGLATAIRALKHSTGIPPENKEK
jgi:hypothetical protein